MGAGHLRAQPTGFSWVWPLVDVPVRLADGTFANDSLAAAIAPGGRLDRLLQSGAALSEGAAVTWAIDPDLVETIADMGDDNGYQVVTPDNGTVPGGGGDLARAWLERLRIATAGEDVLPLPYADPDLVALTHNGLQGDARHGPRPTVPRSWRSCCPRPAWSRTPRGRSTATWTATPSRCCGGRA